MPIKKMYQFILVATLFTAGLTANAQSYKPAIFTSADRVKQLETTYPLVDKLYKDYAEKNHWPGMVYGIVVDGKLVHTGGMGYTDIVSRTPADSKSAFRIASMTKSLTAMAILKLRDEGKLKLDDPAYLYIPEMKGIHYLTKDAAPVTIRHLLTHAAGFPEDNPWGDRQLADTDEELIAFYKKGVSFSHNPGLSYEYSNLGFATLGYIIKRVSGKTYEEYITENIIKPLGMTHTYWEYEKVPKDKLAHGYRWLDNKWVEQPLLHDGSYGAMGGLITTIEDWAKYMAVHLDAWPPRDDTETSPVKRSSIREMQYPWDMNSLGVNTNTLDGKPCVLVSAYGYGLSWAKDCKDHIYVAHTGGLPGFGSNWKIMPEHGIGVVCFANLTYANASAVNNHVLDSLLRLPGLIPRQLPASAILEQRKNELVKIIADWGVAKESGIFADNFFMDYFPNKLKAEAAEAFAAAGKITGIGKVIPENELRGYFIIRGESAYIKVSFTLTPEYLPMIQYYQLQLLAK